jgi:serine/threonine-protein kinase HipA
MSIQLVGETIDRRRAHALAQGGTLVPLIRGIYVDAQDDIEATILDHAVRIAAYLYPTAYLSSASAALLAPTPDGRLFLSGRRNQRTRLRALEIVQNQAPENPSLTPVVVGDDLGEMRLNASSPRQRFLEAFRLRSEHASAINDGMRTQIAARLVETYGDPKAAADAVWELARALGWYREGEGAERYLLAKATAHSARVNKAALDLTVAWHGQPIGTLIHDGYEWRWVPKPTGLPPLVRETVPGKLPAFIESLLPEGWLAKVLHQRDDRDVLRTGRRYLSNVTIVEDPADLVHLPLDVLQVPLANFTDAGRFTGHYEGPGRGELEETFQKAFAQIFAEAETPRLSGVQIKAPMCLRPDGVLTPATELPFTHILKPAGTSGFEMLPVVEWLCLDLGRKAGLEVPAAALVDMPDNMPRALVEERFDIRRTPDDLRFLALEDFCSVLDLPASAKYDSTIERVARALRPLSNDPVADIETLFRRTVFAWCIADGDMHLKNLALLKIGQPPAGFFSVRLAPLYDAVTTRLFPNLAHDRMALKLAGKDDRLTRVDFMTLARTIDLSTHRATALIDETCGALAKAVRTLAAPGRRFPEETRIADEVAAIVVGRVEGLGL